MTQYVVAITSRGTRETAREHAISLPPRRYSRTGKTYVAACGAQVSKIFDGELFHWGLKRACPNCRSVTGA